MVGKYIKHELWALYRYLIPIAAAVLVFAVLAAIGSLAEADALYIFAMIFTFMGVCVLFVYAFIASVSRFYQSLFTGQGYLTFSIPITPGQILLSKLVSAFVVMVSSVVLAFIAMLIVYAGLPEEGAQAVIEVASVFSETISVYLSSDPLVGVEVVLMILTSLPLGILYCYTVMSVGQLLTKHRKGYTYAIGIGAYFVISVISSWLYMPLLEILLENAGIHAYMWVQILVYLLVDAAMILFVRYILRNKVNLIV